MAKQQDQHLEISRIDREMIERATDLLELCKEVELTIGTAESCTGGLLAAVLTDAPGSSKVFDGGVVTYSNRAKATLLEVPQGLLDSHGAVSEQVARSMAEGVLKTMPVHLSVSITGIAGPEGGTPEKPVGLVHFGAATKEGGTIHVMQKFGEVGRSEVRRKSVLQAIKMLGDLARKVQSERKKSGADAKKAD